MQRRLSFSYLERVSAYLTAAGLALLALALGAWPAPARACGGFFCSATAPVNQAAERIIFAKNNDGSVTAVVEIQYSGPSEHFAWVLPVPGKPNVAVSSNVAFTRLQSASNPQYRLTRRIEGQCDDTGARGDVEVDGSQSVDAGVVQAPTTPVTVVDRGTVGPYDYVVISLDPTAAAPGDAAVEWLTGERFDVSSVGGERLGEYLEGGMNLIAFRLSKGNDTGTIRPIRITYQAECPMIPIRPTAVAADDDMGVLVWVLGEARAVPTNYRTLELDDALIDWTTGGANYDAVVTAAANEAGGQGFVTERAGSSADYDQVVFSRGDDQQWQQVQALASTSPERAFLEALRAFSAWDGFRSAAEKVLAAGYTYEMLIDCAQQRGFECMPPLDLGKVPAFLAEVEADVIEPVRATQALLDSRPYVTRMYTTLSAPEMTVDPKFDFNADLGDVSNLHDATQFIECRAGLRFADAPWRIELPSGQTLRGVGQTDPWPLALGAPEAPAANARVLQLGTTGAGVVVSDNQADIAATLGAHNRRLAPPSETVAGGGDLCTLRPGASRPAGAGALALLALALITLRRLSRRSIDG
ncbi:MAG: DUF2330 domain-containing protein [Myxococcales bacterium]|nr:DUF2330 domain-containing protein [Myxococcales bacterium]